MAIRNGVVCILINDREELLLQKRTRDYIGCRNGWTLFGGRKEEAETNDEAIRRELKEELGIDTTPDFYVNARVRVNGNIDNVAVYVDRINGTKDLRLMEGNGFAYFSRGEIGRLKLGNMHRKMINRFHRDYKMIKNNLEALS